MLPENSDRLSKAQSPAVKDVKLTLLLIFGVALSVRLAYLAWQGVKMVHDSEAFILLAQNLLQHQIFSEDRVAAFSPSIWRAPLYPAFLALLNWLGISSLVGVAAIQAVLDSFTAVMVFLLARKVVPLKAALLASLVYAIHPGALTATSRILSETLFAFLLAGAILLIAEVQRKTALKFSAMSGVMIGLATLCRSNALLLPLILAALLIIFRVPRAYLHAGLLIICAAIIIAPWSIRSSRVADRLVFVQDTTLVVMAFYVTTRLDWDLKNEEDLWHRFENEDEYGKLLHAAQTPQERAQASRFGIQKGLQNIATAPGAYAVSRLRYLPYLLFSSFDIFTGFNTSFGQLRAQGDLLRFSLKVLLLVMFSFIPLLLSVLGLWHIRRNMVAALCAAVWTYTLLFHLPLWFEYRYFLPSVPFLIVSATVGLNLLINRRKMAESLAPSNS